jgi:hypothetical protein
VLARFGDPVRPARRRRGALRRAGRPRGIVRALDAEEIAIETLQLHQPSLDDVFLAKTGRSLEGAAEDDEQQTVGGLAMEPAACGERGPRRPGLLTSPTLGRPHDPRSRRT